MKIVTLTLNPAFDVHCYTEDFQPYRENLAKVLSRDAGGKGVNISRALREGGVENTAVVVLGRDNAPQFASCLENDGICYESITVEGSIRENITLHTSGRDETRISFSGFEADGELLCRVRALLERVLDGEAVLTFTGRIPEGIDKSDIKKMLRELRERGVRVVVDSRSFDKSDILELSPFLIKPNEEEIAMYADAPVCDLESAARAAERLREQGIENVMISLGSRGAALCCEEGVFVASAPRIEAISTIGAGDSSIAGFLAALKSGATYADMLRTAVAYGSAACLTEGTKPPRKSDVLTLLEQIKVERVKMEN